MKSKTAKPKHTIKEILDKYLNSYLSSSKRRYLSDEDLHVLNRIKSCQTARLGLYRFECNCCGSQHRLPRSCKSRFCSKCGSADTLKWIRQLVKRLPDIKYHHVVFTLPSKLRIIAKRNKERIYNLMFESSQAVIKEAFSNKHNLLPGIISVLHTNGSDLKYHPHIHQIVSSGGLCSSEELEELSGDYLFPQRVLGNSYNKLMLKGLLSLYNKGLLNLPLHLSTINSFGKYIEKLKSAQWIVHIDKPIIGVEKIVAYVGRYTKKSCISERRIRSIEGDRISLSYKDYKNSDRNGKPKEGLINLSVKDFLDRLLDHLPLKGFKVVRYYGMFSSHHLGKIGNEYLVSDLNIGAYESEELDGVEIGEDRFKVYRQQVYAQTGKDPLYCYECQESMELIGVEVETKAGLRYYEYENSE